MSGVNTLASTALGITDTMQGFIEARKTVFSLLNKVGKEQINSEFYQKPYRLIQCSH